MNGLPQIIEPCAKCQDCKSPSMKEKKKVRPLERTLGTRESTFRHRRPRFCSIPICERYPSIRTPTSLALPHVPGERSQAVVPSPWGRDSERGPQVEAQREKHSTMEIKQSLNPGQISRGLAHWLARCRKLMTRSPCRQREAEQVLPGSRP